MTKRLSTATIHDDRVFVSMDRDTASELVSLLDAHVAGDVVAYGSPVFKFLRAMSNLGLPQANLSRDKELSQLHGHSVVSRLAEVEIEPAEISNEDVVPW